jgi:hypothetical protein
MKTLLFLSASLLLADDAKAPEITIQEQLVYQRLRANLSDAQRAFDNQIFKMQRICGERQLIMGANGDPICGQETTK